MQTSGTSLTVDTVACAVLNKLHWQPFSYHSEIKAALCGSEKARFPCPIINRDQPLLKGYDKWQKSCFWPICLSTWASILPMLYRMFPECVGCWQAFCACEFSTILNYALHLLHSPKTDRILGPQSLQLYCSKRIRGGGEEECLWGILVFTFNLELRAVAWETKPKKKNLIFACTFKSSNGRMCFCVERKPSKFKGPIRWGLLSAHSPHNTTGTFYHTANQIECINNVEKQKQKRLKYSSLVMWVLRHLGAAESMLQCSQKTHFLLVT